MTRPEIIELVKVLTERKLEKILNYNSLYTLVIQNLCGQSRFWWRQMTATFSLAQGTTTYDTTAVAMQPDLGQIAIEEVIELAIVQSGQAPTWLTPVFDSRTQIEMRSGLGPTGQVGQQGTPGRYMMDFNDYKTLRVDAPDSAYPMMIAFWAMPDPRTESANDTVPLVPPWHHKAIVYGMEAEIWRTAYGAKSDKYITAKAKYDEAVMLAQARPRYSTNVSQQLIQGERGVQST